MNLIAEKFAALINVKTIVTFAITFVFVVLSLRGDINADNVMTVFIMVIGFYFGVQFAQEHKKSAHKTVESTEAEQGNSIYPSIISKCAIIEMVMKNEDKNIKIGKSVG